MKVSYNNTKHEYFGKIQKYNTSNSIDVLETIQTITTNNQKRQDVYNNQNLFYVQLSAGNSYVSSLHCSLMSDGRVYTMPYLTTTARIYDPINNKVIIPSGTFLSGSYIGSVCLNNGKIICIPTSPSATVKIKIYDPASDTLVDSNTTLPTGSLMYISGVKLKDGRVFLVPYNTTTAYIYNPYTDTVTIPSGSYPGANAYRGGVLMSDGRVFMFPYGASTSGLAAIYDPVTDTKTTFSLGIYGHCSGVVLPDGRIFCNPSSLSYATIVVPHFTQFQSNNNQFPLQLLLSGHFNPY